ncbi:hypothetical protein [Metallosphaera hakonensis]|uniref:Uncharacterized protein n=1 Tax=Metallosphaera hakonensis JCM 8857 = DSM 7519 TaxID=1293036 RepID=A0A2U9IVD5_9CREN|nr:hypothetical protein [Metallosphaera hakonensis]AWR99817.1 hypothetical protein DFR87_09060 [Metallosphaera hakonensis JCM 8857 = DSM 7519]
MKGDRGFSEKQEISIVRWRGPIIRAGEFTSVPRISILRLSSRPSTLYDAHIPPDSHDLFLGLLKHTNLFHIIGHLAITLKTVREFFKTT